MFRIFITQKIFSRSSEITTINTNSYLISYRMFVDSCKRLRIMKGSEAIGLGMYIQKYIIWSSLTIYIFVNFYM